jgi:hypothetical protein
LRGVKAAALFDGDASALFVAERRVRRFGLFSFFSPLQSARPYT